MTQDTRSTFEEKLLTIYSAVRAGKDPDTGNLHMDEEQFVQAIRDLIKSDVINVDKIIYIVKGREAETDRYCEIREELRAEQRANLMKFIEGKK